MSDRVAGLLPDNGLSTPIGKRDSLSFRVTREYHGLTPHELTMVLKNIEPSVLVRGGIQASEKNGGNVQCQRESSKGFEGKACCLLEAL